ncbi:MAG: tetratricopeptide repeat protein [Acidobacteria bacterium]|nr:tetratricopeptide repeat protein [Acidobacteriota bacterium]
MSQMAAASRLLAAFLLSATMLVSPLPAGAQDLVVTESITSGSSCFVFRESRKKPQARGAVGHASFNQQSSVHRKNHLLIASLAQKRRNAAIAKRKAAASAADRRIAMSNMLTTKAEGFLDSGQTDLAITNYRDALIQNPRNARASEGLSNALTSKGIDVAGDHNSEAAVPFFEEAVKLDKQNDVAYAKLAAIYDDKGDNAQAIANYESAIRLNREFSTLFTPLGLAYLDSGNIDKAEQNAKLAEAAGVDTPDLHYLRGVIFFKQNRNSESVAEMDKAIALDATLASAEYYRGQAFERMDRPDDALIAYKRALEIDPATTSAELAIGVIDYNKGDYNGALVAYQNVVKAEPQNYQAHANLASTLRQLERYADANAEYKIASGGIKTADLYSEWGFCLGKTNEWEKSVARLQTANEISPDAIDNTNVGWAYYNQANAQTKDKDDASAKTNYEQAKVYSEKATQLDPNLDAAYLNLGSSHNALGEFQLAVDALNTAVRLHNGWAIALNQLGVGYRGLKDFSNAINTFNQVVSLDGNNTVGLFNLGEAYYASGDKKNAKKTNERLKKIDPSLASRLDDIFSGKVVVDSATDKIKSKIPKIPFP